MSGLSITNADKIKSLEMRCEELEDALLKVQYTVHRMGVPVLSIQGQVRHLCSPDDSIDIRISDDGNSICLEVSE